MAARANVLDRPASKPALYLRDHRMRIAAWIGGGEGLLMLLGGEAVHVGIYILAVVSVAFYVLVRRNYSSAVARNLAWIFAASQCFAVLVPIVEHIVKTVLVIVIAVIAIVALIMLFAESKRDGAHT